MDLDEEIEKLRRLLDELAADDDETLARYELSWPRMPPGLYWRLRWVVGCTLRWFESVGLKKLDPWPAMLKHHSVKKSASPILIWAVGSDSAEVRKSCLALAERQYEFAGFVPVLVTDSADFAFFSRLGWLVEYLPKLSGEGDPYERRKARFLARLYRGALAIPVSATPQIRKRGEIQRLIATVSER